MRHIVEMADCSIYLPYSNLWKGSYVVHSIADLLQMYYFHFLVCPDLHVKTLKSRIPYNRMLRIRVERNHLPLLGSFVFTVIFL